MTDEQIMIDRLFKLASRLDGKPPHASDCSMNNAPAMDAGPCDCGADKIWNEAVEKAASIAMPQLDDRRPYGLWRKRRVKIAEEIRQLIK